MAVSSSSQCLINHCLNDYKTTRMLVFDSAGLSLLFVCFDHNEIGDNTLKLEREVKVNDDAWGWSERQAKCIHNSHRWGCSPTCRGSRLLANQAVSSYLRPKYVCILLYVIEYIHCEGGFISKIGRCNLHLIFLTFFYRFNCFVIYVL